MRVVVVMVIVVLLGAAACSSPTAPTEAPGIIEPTRVTYATIIGPGGAASRAFTARFPGTATAVVSGITPATPLSIGLGIPRADGSECLLARSATATDGATATVSSTVSAGLFCVQVSAPTGSADVVSFSVTLDHP